MDMNVMAALGILEESSFDQMRQRLSCFGYNDQRCSRTLYQLVSMVGCFAARWKLDGEPQSCLKKNAFFFLQ